MMNSGTNALLRSIPAMEELLNTPKAREFSASLGREQVKTVIAGVLAEIRSELRAGSVPDGELRDAGAARGGGSAREAGAGLKALAACRSEAALRKLAAGTLKPVVNATGVVVHTNLGRAPLAKEALTAAGLIAGAYSTLEYSPESGGRGSRNNHVESLVCQITGAQAALAVNNNAAAVLLALSAIAAGREVIVSCGELVEIGDSFRIPEILAFSGAKMRVVGCTNSARIEDYRAAISENTAALLKVHPSNYRIEGFVQSVSREELARLAAERNIAFIEDLGSGLLCRPKIPFARHEHSVRDCLEAGSGIVTFSGDKLLGGPQIGVIAGAGSLVDKMRRHQLLRALRVDKMTLAAFEATLRIYRSGREAEIPVVRMLEENAETLQKKARNLCRLLRGASAGGFSFSVVETRDAVGGGAFPVNALAGFGVAVRSATRGAENIAGALRQAAVPVITAVREGQVILHVRTLLAGDEKRIALAFATAFAAL